MLEIKTITADNSITFDKMVNAALKDGWELTRRECFRDLQKKWRR